MKTFKIKIQKLNKTSELPKHAKHADWLFGTVLGYWNAKTSTAEIYTLPQAREDEIALVKYHEKAHFLLKHSFFTNRLMMWNEESRAWQKTLEILPRKYKTKHILSKVRKVRNEYAFILD